MIVADASAALSALLNAGPARRALGTEQLHVPHLIDAEVASGLRRRVASAEIGPDAGWAALDVWRRLGIIRYPLVGILGRVWQLRELGCALLTADQRMTRAPGTRCPITVVPR